jgi:hypothetical protein
MRAAGAQEKPSSRWRRPISEAKPAEPSNDAASCPAVTPDQLRDEADSAERLARVVSFNPDKAWLCAKAAELRRLADRMEGRSWLPADAQEAAQEQEPRPH